MCNDERREIVASHRISTRPLAGRERLYDRQQYRLFNVGRCERRASSRLRLRAKHDRDLDGKMASSRSHRVTQNIIKFDERGAR